MFVRGKYVSISSDLKEENAQEIADAANCEDIHMMIGAHYFPFPYTREDALDFINLNRMSGSETFMVDFLIRKEETIVGIIGLSDINMADRSAHVGYWISCNHRNRGYASEALGLVCDYARDSLGLFRLHTKVMEINTASLRVLLRNQFKVEGYERSAFLFKGKRHDMFCLARLL